VARILIADQHAIVREGLRSVVESQLGWEVVAEVEDGNAAILEAIETSPDIAVLDCYLPLASGLTVIRQIRERLQTEILVFTMHADERLIREAVRMGARGYLLKSDSSEMLVEAFRFRKRC
jgi:DNA-binding NarL/FixJ family response regulator